MSTGKKGPIWWQSEDFSSNIYRGRPLPGPPGALPRPGQATPRPGHMLPRRNMPMGVPNDSNGKSINPPHKIQSKYRIFIIESSVLDKKNSKFGWILLARAGHTEGPWHATDGPVDGIEVAIEVLPHNPIKYWHSNHRSVLWAKKKNC